ncbi:unnamed protein product, partial [marine sediment metagenome]
GKGFNMEALVNTLLDRQGKILSGRGSRTPARHHSPYLLRDTGELKNIFQPMPTIKEYHGFYGLEM